MKNKVLYIGILISTIGCNNYFKEPSNNSNNDISSVPIDVHKNSTFNESQVAIWTYDFDKSTNDFKPIKLREFNRDTLTPDGIEKIINKSWPKVQIEFLNTYNDTIVISIPNSYFLTQKMGTTGAEQFIISTTYSFTELKDVSYVKFEFEMGDHANPGVYSRGSWNEN